MSIAIVTGAAGLIGAEAVRFLAAKGLEVVGVDNDMRARFFGEEASTDWARQELERSVAGYRHEAIDIRDEAGIDALFARYGRDVTAVIHCAAQPSHDWAARDPKMDFSVNATGTLNLLESVRQHCPEAAFVFTSTNKVYGDTPNRLPLEERDSRWELEPRHPFAARGIDETMSIDSTLHSLFGASKAAADLLVQEYGRYFGLNAACFRGGCLTGPGHSGAELHGFLAYLFRCAIEGRPYRVFGYKGKQVRDNILAPDLVNAFWHYIQAPRPGEVYNIGGGRHANCSMLEAIEAAERLSGNRLDWTYVEENRRGDHIWWVSDISKFQKHYPDWTLDYDMEGIFRSVHDGMADRLAGAGHAA